MPTRGHSADKSWFQLRFPSAVST